MGPHCAFTTPPNISCLFGYRLLRKGKPLQLQGFREFQWIQFKAQQRGMAETESGGSVHATRFEAAVKVIQSLPKNGK